MADPLITFILPFFNEEQYLGRTLACLDGQNDRRFALRLVDNASTDRSLAIAKEWARSATDIQVDIMQEPRPGKLFALQSGSKEIKTPLIGTLDADTEYPSEYVERTISAFSIRPDLAAFIALPADDSRKDDRASPSKWLQVALQPSHCHGGGCGQTFWREALERAGGFDPDRWPFILEDHEIVHAVGRFGPIGYNRDHTFRTAQRREAKGDCSWSLVERIGYKILPASAGSWYFHRVLAPRFAARGLANIALRSQSWNDSAISAEL
uniref:glycosyltransferase family 2 protein n=1 Tax=uncultured Altererythrobacter sp. TaxID=500840 RepID=UPI00261FCEA0|nr:glycosyltransferase family A protein [uncultured Altererythrobacter sp.]